MPPKKDMRCDFCGAELYQRPDDKEETIKNRLRIYQEQTAPVICALHGAAADTSQRVPFAAAPRLIHSHSARLAERCRAIRALSFSLRHNRPQTRKGR